MKERIEKGELTEIKIKGKVKTAENKKLLRKREKKESCQAKRQRKNAESKGPS